MKVKRWLVVVVAIVVLANLLACTIDDVTMDYSWREQTADAVNYQEQVRERAATLTVQAGRNE